MKIQHPLRGIIDFSANYEQKRIIDCYSQSRKIVIQKERQIGLTTAFVILAVEEAQKKYCTIDIIVPSLITARNVAKKIKLILGHEHKMRHECFIYDEDYSSFRFENGSRIRISSENFFLRILEYENRDLNILMLDEYEYFSNLTLQNIEMFIQESKKFVACSSPKSNRESTFACLSAKIIDSSDVTFESTGKMRFFAVK